MFMTDFKARKSVRSALMGTALALPMLAVTGANAQEQMPENPEACVQLQEIAGGIDFGATTVTQDDVEAVIQAGDAEQCSAWLTEVQANVAVGSESAVVETQQARVRLEDEVVIEGRVIVDQQPPTLQIQEQPLQITVGTALPEVSVTEGQVDILVRQAAPTITFEMPQPTITIVQPAPEIIITMPDPSVQIAGARPQVEVRQAEPQISISMPDPTVELDLYQAEDGETSAGIAVERRQGTATGDGATTEPEVTITRAEAEIIYQEDQQDGQQASVNLSRSQPNIRFEQAEPQIEIVSATEPQVSWSQSGEPVVRFEDAASQDGTDAAAAPTDADAGAAAEADEQTEETGQNVIADPANDPQMGGGPAVRRDGYRNVDVAGMTATDLDGMSVYGVRGEEIGEIGQFTTAGGDAQELILEVGGFLGIGERRVRVPMSEVSLLQDENSGEFRAYINATEEDLMAYPEVN